MTMNEAPTRSTEQTPSEAPWGGEAGIVTEEMAAGYVKDFCDELRKLGDTVWKRQYRTPMLIVLGKAAELTEGKAFSGITMVATPSGDVTHMALVNRVFAVAKAPHAPRGPIVLGRSGDADVAIPEYSISKRHCYFDFEADGIKVTDCGSTNGTLVGGQRLVPGEPATLKDGTALAIGRFAFSFHTAVGFHAHVKSLLA